MVTSSKKLFTLEGKLLTPLLSSTFFFKKHGCWCKIVSNLTSNKKAPRSYVGLLTKGERKAPNQLLAFRGFIKVTCVEQNEEKGRKRIEKILAYDNLGCNSNQGFGKIKWLNYKVESYKKQQLHQYKKFKIRKGLGPNYPQPLQRLLIALMLHDFVLTEKHPSKIYQEIEIKDTEIREACLNHHSKETNGNELIRLIKRYDSIASSITRKGSYKTNSRYDITQGEIDFSKLKEEIEEKLTSAYRLYNFIYDSDEMKRIVETMSCGKSSLRTHLLLMVNLAINEYYSGKLKIKKGKISLSAK